MRGCGKTTLGKALASELGYAFTDTDEVFEAEFGTIQAFVAQYGWPPFRLHEERILRDAIRDKTVLALGGGAIESEANRRILRHSTAVIWIQAEVETIVQRLLVQEQEKVRPALTDLPLEEEVRMKMEQRTPLWAETADIVIPANAEIEQQIAMIRRELGIKY